jgi:hypothetical protein
MPQAVEFMSQAAPAQSPHGLSQHVFDGVVGRPPQEAIHSGVVGHAQQSQHGAQFARFAQTYFGFAKGPVFVAHQTENGHNWGCVIGVC